MQAAVREGKAANDAPIQKSRYSGSRRAERFESARRLPSRSRHFPWGTRQVEKLPTRDGSARTPTKALADPYSLLQGCLQPG
jgi:hypothetical protein